MRRLGVERIDLFQLHRIDSSVPAAAQFGVLRDLRDEGKVAEVGLSEVTVADAVAAQEIVPIRAVQNQYNLGRRGAEDVVDHCERQRIGFIPWFPLASGRPARDVPLEQIAREVGASPSQVSIAWLLRRSRVMLPIPGTSSVADLEENCGIADVQLTDAQFQTLAHARRALRRMALN